MLRAFRSSARVLILHGKTNTVGDEWEVCNRKPTSTFLDAESLAVPDEWPIGKASLRRWTTDGRTVFQTWAFNGGALA
jgi:hypothetical protein